MNMREDFAKEARFAGKKAFREALGTPNPHPLGTLEGRNWNDGWHYEQRLAKEKLLFPKEVTETDEYKQFVQFLRPNFRNMTNTEYLSHWWHEAAVRKSMFDLWKNQE